MNSLTFNTGDLYKQSSVLESQRNLYESNLFRLASIDVPTQDNGNGTRYVSTGAVNAGAGCESPRQTLTVNAKTQNALTLTPDPGGAITLPDTTIPDGWQDAGTQLTLVATPSAGFQLSAGETVNWPLPSDSHFQAAVSPALRDVTSTRSATMKAE